MDSTYKSLEFFATFNGTVSWDEIPDQIDTNSLLRAGYIRIVPHTDGYELTEKGETAIDNHN